MTINSLKTALIATIAVGASMTAGATSANAFTIGGSVDFSTAGTIVTGAFSNATVVPDGSAGFSPAGTSVTVADLPLTQTSVIGASNPGISSFISGFTYQGQDAVFDLLAGNDTVLISNVFGVIGADVSFNGVIESVTGDLLATVTGTFSGTQSPTNNDFSINLSATPVPTPALLPGLLGMGMGVVRKRKQQSQAAA